MDSCAFIVEGPDDEVFFRRVIIPELEKRSTLDFEVIISKSWSERDYSRQFDYYDEVIIIKDIDDERCPSRKKNKFCTTFKLHHKKDCVCIVIYEIESWYLAVGSHQFPKLPRRYLAPSSTESVRKEDFNRELAKLYPAFSRRRSAVLMEMIKSPDIKAGLGRNSSLRYFSNKLRTKLTVDMVS